jgi:hypothetical protein
MDVFLIPTTTSERYELYYEAPEEEVVEDAAGTGIVARMKRRFATMLQEAEEWRHRRHEQASEQLGVIAKLRRKVMGFVVERIAEQRLLWHMRKETEICARIPADLSETEADQIIRTRLKHDADHHFKWLLIDLTLLLLSTPLIVIPGPNIPGFYFTFQVVGHYLSMRGAKQGLAVTQWTYKPSADLSELREVMTLPPPQRHRRFRELANRLRLEHLATFCEDVAAPTA